MMDLLSIVPYYTAHLCAALASRPEVELEVGSIHYYLDPNCFKRLGVGLNPGPLDIVSRIPFLPSIVRRVLKTGEYLVNLAWFAARLAFDSPDVVHVQFLPLVLFGLPIEPWLLRFARRRGAKIVYTVHNVLPHDTAGRHRRLYQKLYDQADRLICHDSAAKRQLSEEYGQQTSRISIIPHGQLLPPQPLSSRSESRRRLGISEDECVVLWQGILRPYKGVSFLLDAWRLTSPTHPKARLAIVGGGDAAAMRETREKVSAMELSATVRLDLRFVCVSELEDLHSAADILVYPYAEATTSGALMTGIGYGKAVIATRIAAFEQILNHDENALLVVYGDTQAFSSALNRLIDDAGLRLRLGERLRRLNQHLISWGEIAEMTSACYAALDEVTS